MCTSAMAHHSFGALSVQISGLQQILKSSAGSLGFRMLELALTMQPSLGLKLGLGPLVILIALAVRRTSASVLSMNPSAPMLTMLQSFVNVSEP